MKPDSGGSPATGQVCFHSTPLHSTPLHSTPLHSTPLHSTPLHSTPLHSIYIYIYIERERERETYTSLSLSLLYICVFPPKEGVQVVMVSGYSRVPHFCYSEITHLLMTCPTPPGWNEKYTWLISNWAHFSLGSCLIGLNSNCIPS